ncbi:MAG: cytochrome P450 family protein [Trebonia sp.]
MPGTSELPSGAPIRLDQEFYQDAHSVDARVRTEGPARPVLMPDGRPGWLVTSYSEARALLTDPRLSKDARGVAKVLPPGLEGAFASPLMANMLFSDPPDHTRLRRLVSKAFTSRAIERLRPRIGQAADELLEALSGGVPVDLIDGYALPLPVIVICDLLGVPASDRAAFREWTLGFVTDLLPDAEDKAVIGMRISEYLSALINAKRDNPGDDLLSGLAHVADEEDRLSQGEILSMAFLLLTAGFETTVNLIANGVLALVQHPDQLALVRSDPSLLPGAVEEFLRYESPVHVATERFTTEPVRVGETEIPAGQLVHISVLAANRDGARFTEPDRLDITRQPAGHLTFGHGIHHCIGAPLARLEAEIAIGRLLARFPGLALASDAGPLRWHDSTLMHGLRSLPVRLTVASQP